jgi:hypothetical protein
MLSRFRSESSAWGVLCWWLLASAGCPGSDAAPTEPRAAADSGTPPQRTMRSWPDAQGPQTPPPTPKPDGGVDAGTPAHPDGGPLEPAADSGSMPDRDVPDAAPPHDASPVDASPVDASAADAGSEPPRPVTRLIITSAPTSASSGPMSMEFSVSEVRELYVSSVHVQLTGEHRELRRFYPPSGDLYYEKLLAYSTDLTEPAPFVDPVSIPHSTQIVPVAPDVLGRLLISDVFPVAGTWISDRSMTGSWRVESYLDGATEPDATVQFELIP